MQHLLHMVHTESLIIKWLTFPLHNSIILEKVTHVEMTFSTQNGLRNNHLKL
jgi:hypothetical protein